MKYFSHLLHNKFNESYKKKVFFLLKFKKNLTYLKAFKKRERETITSHKPYGYED